MATIKEEVVPDFLELGKFKPIMSMTKDSFKEMQQFFLMKIIAGYSDGITAYQIQSNYHFPRSNVIRLLSNLEEQKYLLTQESILDGRANKFYILSQKGFTYLAELKSRWKERFTMMEELTSSYFTPAEKAHFIKNFVSIKDKEKQLKYLEDMRSGLERKIIDLDRKKLLLGELGSQLDRIIENVQNMDDELTNSQVETFFSMLPGDKGDN